MIRNKVDIFSFDLFEGPPKHPFKGRINVIHFVVKGEGKDRIGQKFQECVELFLGKAAFLV